MPSLLSFSPKELKKPFGNSAKPDLIFLIAVVVLSICGTLAVFSAGIPYAAFRYSDGGYFIKRQIFFLLIGLGVFFVSSRIRVDFLRSFTPILYLGTFFLLMCVLFIGLTGNGAKRWISIGPITIQPSEIGKCALVLLMAKYYETYRKVATDRISAKNVFLWGTLFPCLLLLSFVIPIMLQKHLSCVIIMCSIGLIMMIIGGSDTRFLRIFILIGFIGICALALFTDYTKDRITVWLNPEAYKLEGGWQTLQGLMAIGSGGLFGRGIFKGVLKYCYISEPANDMIFAVVCEETGFLGACCVIALFLILVWRGFRIAAHLDDVFARTVVFGLTAKTAVQVLLNLAVVTNSIPNTGISLPFFSYGGSSLVMLFFEMGTVVSLSRYANLEK